ncbi:MAG: response regulator transcription factor [Pseudomonadota bacterium]
MIRIALVDDHAVVREGYRSLISRQRDMTVTLEFDNAAAAYGGISDHPNINVLVMDINMPGASAFSTLRRLKQRFPKIASLVFTMYAKPRFAQQSFSAGAVGYVTKSNEPEVLLRAIREAAGGRRYLSPDIAQLLALERFQNERDAIDSLSNREFEVLRLLLEGRDVESIASSLNISPKTVRNLHYSIKRKFGVRDDIELVRRAISLDVIDLLELGAQSSAEDGALEVRPAE